MAGITSALLSAQSGVLSNTEALGFVANNIANVNTPGFTRRVVNFESVTLAGAPAGVQIGEITREVDEGLLASLREELSDLNQLTVQEDFFARIQDTFGAPGDNTSISNILQDFQEATELLAVTPDTTLEQSEFLRQAGLLVEQLQDTSEVIQDLRVQADQSIATEVARLNELTQTVDTLNDDIIAIGSVGTDVSDLLDQRDTAINEISEIIDIDFFFASDGDAVIFTGSGETLVDVISPVITHEPVSSISPVGTAASGEIDGIFVGPPVPGNDITNDIAGGTLAGLISQRDEVLPNLQAQLDELAGELQTLVNQINNRGVAFPGVQEFNGTRVFVEPDAQTITIDPTAGQDDVAIVLFDANGVETESIRLTELLSSGEFGDGTDLGRTTTITELASRLEDFLQANGAPQATVNTADGNQFDITLNQPALNLAFRDEISTTPGSDFEDAEIGFDSNGDGTIDETVLGFSNFFGLNDFFVDSNVENIFESNVLSNSFSSTAATLSFDGFDGEFTGSPLSIPAGSSLTDIANLVSLNVDNVTASVIPDGAGSRLRFASDDGASFTVTQAPTDSLLTDIGFGLADVGLAGEIGIREDIVIQPSLISTGRLQFDETLGINGEYVSSIGDNSVIEELAEALADPITFETAGGLGSQSVTFDTFGATIISASASLALTNETAIEAQQSFTDSIQFRADSVSGVNLDEELADLIIFQQAFNASAQVLSTISELIDTLAASI